MNQRCICFMDQRHYLLHESTLYLLHGSTSPSASWINVTICFMDQRRYLLHGSTSLSLSHTHTHTLSITLSLTLTLCVCLSHTHTLSLTLSLSLTHTHTHTHTHTLSRTHAHTHTQSHVRTVGQKKRFFFCRDSQDIEADSDGRGDEHDGAVYFVVPALDPLHCRLHQHHRQHPQQQDGHQRPQDLWQKEAERLLTMVAMRCLTKGRRHTHTQTLCMCIFHT